MRRDLWILMAGQFVSVVGDGLAAVAVLWWVLQATGSVALMATVAAVLALTAVVASPFAGVWVDRLDRRGLMMAVDGVRAICYGALAAVAAGGRLPLGLMVALLAVARIAGTGFYPALASALPRLVPSEKDLPRANSLLSFAQSGGQILGAALGGALVAAFGVAAALGLDAASFVASVASLAVIAIPAGRAAAATASSFAAELRDGLRYAGSDPLLRLLIPPSLFLNALINAILVLLPALAAGPLHAGAQGYGLLQAALPVGIVLGSAAVASLGLAPRRAAALYGVLAATGAALAAVGLVPALPWALAAMIVAGALIAVMNASINALLQASIPAEIQGRVFSLLGAVSQGLSPVSQGAAGLAAAAWTAGRVIAASGGGIVAVAFGFGGASVRAIDSVIARAQAGAREGAPTQSSGSSRGL